MSDRPTAATITDEELNRLYAQLAQAEQEANDSVAAAVRLTALVGTRAARAEKVITRVRAVCDEPNHSNMVLTQHVLTALAEQPGPAATEATQAATTVRVFAALHHSAEQDVTRVIALYEQWVKAGWPPLGTPLSRWWDARLVELHDAIRPPTT